jgi:hypothetical protein
MYQLNTKQIYLYKEILEAVSKLTGIHYNLLGKINQVKGDRLMITYYNLNDERELLEIETSKVLEVIEAKRLPRSWDIHINPTPENDVYTALNVYKNSRYLITPFSDSIHCTCPDYEGLVYYFHTNQVCCKHVHSFLRKLCYQNLASYLKSNQELPKNHHQQILYPDINLAEEKEYQAKYSDYLDQEMYLKDDQLYYV